MRGSHSIQVVPAATSCLTALNDGTSALMPFVLHSMSMFPVSVIRLDIFTRDRELFFADSFARFVLECT